MNEERSGIARVAVNGAAGRMGRGCIREILNRSDLKLVRAWEAGDRPEMGEDAGLIAGGRAADVPLTAFEPADEVDVILDFSHHKALETLLERSEPKPLISGTTGLGEKVREELWRWAECAPVISSPNFSLGVNLLLKLTEAAARGLPAEYAAEIFELHHGQKKDSPSGTALRLGAAVAAGRGLVPDEANVYARPRMGEARKTDEIGYAAARGGDVVGEHTVFFLGEGERLELTHRATDRLVFVKGAVHCAARLAGKAPGMYTVGDLL